MKKPFKKQNRLTQYSQAEDLVLGNKTRFEVTMKAIEALFNFANGVKQAANITNAQLSQKAKDGLNYLQDLDSMVQQIKILKQQTDSDLDAIDSMPEDPEEVVQNG